MMCHNCMQTATNLVNCPGCDIFRYCSEGCRIEDWYDGQHSTRCNFIRYYCCGSTKNTGNDGTYNSQAMPTITSNKCVDGGTNKTNDTLGETKKSTRGALIEIGCNDIPFRFCEIVEEKEESYYGLKDEEGAPPSHDIHSKVKFLEEQRTLEVGATGEIVLLSHQVDAGGSFVVKLLSSQGISEKARQLSSSTSLSTSISSSSYIVCDVFALEPASMDICVEYNENTDVLSKSHSLWKAGLDLWFAGDLLRAMSKFQLSLECFTWADSTGSTKNDESGEDFNGQKQKNYWPAMSVTCHSSFRDTKLRRLMAQRCCFLAMCLADNEQLNTAISYLIRCINTKPMADSFHCCSRELVLLFEEEEQKQQQQQQSEQYDAPDHLLMATGRRMIQCARDAAQFAIDKGAGNPDVPWINRYQRPGFCTSLLIDPTQSNSFYDIDHPQYPTWCHDLAKNYPTIKQEFMALFRKCNDKIGHPSNSSCASILRTVGGDHRASGQHDARVVTSGTWKEVVLFGSGREHTEQAATANTRRLLHQVAPDAVSLCFAGAGEIIFSVLSPRTRIAPHCASTNVRLTAHLGLLVPPFCSAPNGEAANSVEELSAPQTSKSHQIQDELHASHASIFKDPSSHCAIRVAETWHMWEEGKFIVFDDSFEHEVVNDTDYPRAVLLLRFWHPSIPSHQREKALEEIHLQMEQSRKLRFTPPLTLDPLQVDASEIYCNDSHDKKDVWEHII